MSVLQIALIVVMVQLAEAIFVACAFQLLQWTQRGHDQERIQALEEAREVARQQALRRWAEREAECV